MTTSQANTVHPLLIEVNRFDEWAKLLSEIPQDERGGEWECDYPNWNRIYDLFDEFIQSNDPTNWTRYEKEHLLYIIARDNEREILASKLSTNPKELILLTEESIINGHRDDKWQLAVQLTKLEDTQIAIVLLEKLVNDKEEYVNRRALMELAKLQADSVESYCEQFWNRRIYGDDEEYQRMAVLQALKDINSNLLDYYIELAREDGRRHLTAFANELTR